MTSHVPRPIAQFSLKTLLLWSALLPPAIGLLFAGGSDWLAQFLCRLLGGAIIGFCVGTAVGHRLRWSAAGLLIACPPLACLAFVIFGAMKDAKWTE